MSIFLDIIAAISSGASAIATGWLSANKLIGGGTPVAWNAVSTNGTDTFVAVAASSTVAGKSTDGVNWTQTTMPSAGTWSSVCYGNGNFVAISAKTAASGVVAYSTNNGDTWTQVTALPTLYWTKVVFDGTNFVAITGSASATSTRVAYSTDGISWLSPGLPMPAATTAWWDITYGGDKYVAITGGNTATTVAAYSTQGINWVLTTLKSTVKWAKVAYNGGYNSTPTYVAISGYNGASTATNISTDGVNWQVGGLATFATWVDITFGLNTFVAISGGAANTVANRTTDGVTWTAVSLPASVIWKSITYGQGTGGANPRFVAIATTSVSVSSTDAITWTAASLPGSTTWNKVIFDGTNYVAFSQSSYVTAKSTDGISWSSQVIAPQSQSYSAVAYNGVDKYVVIAGFASGNTGMYSTDGLSWTQTTLTTTATFISHAIYAKGKFIAIPGSTASNSSTVGKYSTDGVSWSTSVLPLAQSWQRLAYDGADIIFAIAGVTANTTAASSTDGITWTRATMPGATATWTALTRTSNRFIAIAGGGTASNRVVYSTDGVTWVAGTGLSSAKWTAVEFNGTDRLVAIAGYNAAGTAAAYSIDNGATWVANANLPSGTWKELAYGNGVFVTLDSANSATRAAYSTDGVTWATATLPQTTNWYSIIFDGTKFIAINSSNTNYTQRAAYSTDGINWYLPGGFKTGLGLNVTGSTWSTVAYNGTSYNVFPDTSHNVGQTSTDCVNWVAYTNIGNQDIVPTWVGAASNSANQIIAITSDGRITSSTENQIWNRYNLIQSKWADVAYNNNLFVAISGYNVASVLTQLSTNGVNWSTGGNLPTSSIWLKVIAGNNTLVAVGTGCAAYSTNNGVTWNSATIDNYSWTSLVYDSMIGQFTAMSQTASATSTDGITWVSTLLSDNLTKTDLTYLNGVYAAVNTGSNVILSSTNGSTWYSAAAVHSTNWSTVKYINDRYIALSSVTSDTASVSTNGINWSNVQLPVNQIWNTAINYGSLCLVISSASANAALSTNGINWTRSTLTGSGYSQLITNGTNGKIYAIASGGASINVFDTTTTSWVSYGGMYQSGVWSTVSYNGTDKYVTALTGTNLAAYSTNGVDWVQSTLSTSSAWTHSAYVSGNFVVWATSTTIVCSSTDAINWVTGTTVGGTNITKKIWKLGAVYIQQGQGCLTISTDLISWIGITGDWRLPVPTGAPNTQTAYWCDITYTGGIFYAIGTNSSNVSRNDIWVAYSSDKGVSWTLAYNNLAGRANTIADGVGSVATNNGIGLIVGGSSQTNTSYFTSSNMTSWTFNTMTTATGRMNGLNGAPPMKLIGGLVRVYSATPTYSFSSSDWFYTGPTSGALTGTIKVVSGSSGVAVVGVGAISTGTTSTSNLALVGTNLPSCSNATGDIWYYNDTPSIYRGKRTTYNLRYLSAVGQYVMTNDQVASNGAALYFTGGGAANNAVWNQNTCNLTSSYTCYDVAYGASTYVALTAASNTTCLYGTSLTNMVAATITNISATRVCFGGTRFVMVGTGGMLTSVNGSTWASTGITNSFTLTYTDTLEYHNSKFVALNTSGQFCYSTDGLAWTPRVTITGTNGIAYGNSVYVAGGSASTSIARSTDLITWTTQTVPFSCSGMGHTGTYFITVASASGLAVRSTDGIQWEYLNPFNNVFGTITSISTPNPKCVATNGTDKYIVPCSSGYLFSTDGVGWVVKSTPTGVSALSGACFNGTDFIITGTGSAKSTDLVNWTVNTVSGIGASMVPSVELYYTGTHYVTGSKYGGNVSTDGLTWTTTTVFPYATFNGTWYVAPAKSTPFVASDNSSVAVMVSGASLSTAIERAVTCRMLAGVPQWFANNGNAQQGLGIVKPNNANMVTFIGSTTQLTFTDTMVYGGIKALNRTGVADFVATDYVPFGVDNYYIGLAANGFFVYLKDFQTFTVANNSTTCGVGDYIVNTLSGSTTWKGMAHNGTKLVAIDQSSKLGYITAPNNAWTYATIPTGNWAWIKAIGTKFVAYSNTPEMFITSTDAITWVPLGMPVSTWSDVVYGAGKYVALPGLTNGILAYSTDAITWTTSTALPGYGAWRSIVYGSSIVPANRKFITVYPNGNTIYMSTDAVTWTSGNLPTSFGNPTITHDGVDTYMVVGGSVSTAKGYKSTDGITWVVAAVPTGSGQTWTDIASNGIANNFVAVSSGTNSPIYYSV
jgi:hypothetical protein